VERQIHPLRPGGVIGEDDEQSRSSTRLKRVLVADIISGAHLPVYAGRLVESSERVAPRYGGRVPIGPEARMTLRFLGVPRLLNRL
jgi:hypothetical protein